MLSASLVLASADRGGLVLAHEPAVASDVGGKNGGEPALDRGLFVHHLISDGIGAATAVLAVFSCHPSSASMRVQPSLVDGEEGPPGTLLCRSPSSAPPSGLAYSLQGPLRDHQVAVMAIVVIARPLSVVELPIRHN